MLIERILKRLAEDQAACEQHVVASKCPTFEDYRFVCGQIVALKKTADMIREEARKEEQETE